MRIVIPDRPFSEADLRGYLHEPGREHRQRRQLWAVGNEHLVVRQDRGGVEHVEHIHTDVRSRAADPDNLPDTEVDLGSHAIKGNWQDAFSGDTLELESSATFELRSWKYSLLISEE